VTPSSANTCTIISAPVIFWPASGWRMEGVVDGDVKSRILGVFAIDAGETKQFAAIAQTDILAAAMSTSAQPKALQQMRHIIAIHLQNEAGALTRVAGLFSTRGYNIESLSVAATDDPLVSRVTLVTKGADGVILQIVNQLNKLIDVVAVEDLTRGEHIERELVVLKLRVEPQLIDSVRGYVVRAGGRVLEPSPEGFVVELTASEAEVNQFVSDLGERTELIEVVRSGALAVGRNARALHVVR
jgi:acetolactate synthase-1/3 small subunit